MRKYTWEKARHYLFGSTTNGSSFQTVVPCGEGGNIIQLVIEETIRRWEGAGGS